jgi:hypothetical protein
VSRPNPPPFWVCRSFQGPHRGISPERIVAKGRLLAGMKFEMAQLLLKLTENEVYTVACTDIVLLLQKPTFDPRAQRSIGVPDAVRQGNKKGPWRLVLLEDHASGSIQGSCLGRASLLAKCSSISTFLFLPNFS